MENTKAYVRPSAVAGFFYPDSPMELTNSIKSYLANSHSLSPSSQLNVKASPFALIVPHAGYVYSGPVAASAYKLLEPFRDKIKTVIIMGPAHRIPVEGVALSQADFFQTPLGKTPLDHKIQNELLSFNGFHTFYLAHAEEHSLEVQLPFLQSMLNDFKIVPLLLGTVNPKLTSQCFDKYIDNPELLFVISTDLSHYLNYDQAKSLDQNTATAILNFDLEKISYDSACGANPIKTLLHLAKRHHITPNLLDLRNSGDTAGDKRKVVGYASFVLNRTN